MPVHTVPFLNTDVVVVEGDGPEDDPVRVVHEPPSALERFAQAVEKGQAARVKDVLSRRPLPDDPTQAFRVALTPRHADGPHLTPLAHAVADGDVDMTRVLVDAIADRRDGWGRQRFDADTHFDLLRDGMLAATSRSAPALEACVKAMCRNDGVKRLARAQLPGLLQSMQPFGGGINDVTLTRDGAERTAGWIRSVVAAAKADLISRERAILLLEGAPDRPPVRVAQRLNVATFQAVIEGHAHAGREKLVVSSQLRDMMMGWRNDGTTALHAAAQDSDPRGVSAYIHAVHAARRGGALPNDEDYLNLLSAGRGTRPLLATLCRADAPPQALAAYLNSLLVATLGGANSMTPGKLLKLMLALGDDGHPALTRCSPAQAKVVRDALGMAVEDGRISTATADHLLQFVPRAGDTPVRTGALTRAPDA